MLQKQIPFMIEELCLRAKMLQSFQSALYVAIFCQDMYSEKDYEEAFVLFGGLVYDLANDLQQLTDRAFEYLNSSDCKK